MVINTVRAHNMDIFIIPHICHIGMDSGEGNHREVGESLGHFFSIIAN